jgi:rare lipoprotein A (peptidoglycan hydrolase)
VSPEKGGALRNQSTRGRRAGVAAVICGTLFGAPLLLLHTNTSKASDAATSARHAHAAHREAVNPASHLDGVKLPSHLVAYQAPTTTTPAPPTTTTAPPPPTTTTTVVSHVVHIVTTTTAPPTTTTTAPPRNSEVGQATWYSEAPAGYCASPTLPFGTRLTVVNNATGATTVCTVDDREAAGYPRVVDLSPEGFAQIADPSQGVVEVTISW